jgi:hypothetical protein
MRCDEVAVVGGDFARPVPPRITLENARKRRDVAAAMWRKGNMWRERNKEEFHAEARRTLRMRGYVILMELWRLKNLGSCWSKGSVLSQFELVFDHIFRSGCTLRRSGFTLRPR